jgi:hypothetical protein
MPVELADSLTASEEDRLLQAEAMVRDHCGWHIAPSRTETVTFAAPSGGRLMLPSLYVTAVSVIEIDGAALTVDVDFQVHRSGWVDFLPYGGWWYGDLVEVTFTHGYDNPPAAVTAAVQALAQNPGTTLGTLSRKTTGPFTEVYASPADVLSGLDAYRIVPVA